MPSVGSTSSLDTVHTCTSVSTRVHTQRIAPGTRSGRSAAAAQTPTVAPVKPPQALTVLTGDATHTRRALWYCSKYRDLRLATGIELQQ